MSIIVAEKQLRKELSTLEHQMTRIKAALTALNGHASSQLPPKRFKLSAAARRRIGEGVRKARALHLKAKR